MSPYEIARLDQAPHGLADCGPAHLEAGGELVLVRELVSDHVDVGEQI